MRLSRSTPLIVALLSLNAACGDDTRASASTASGGGGGGEGGTDRSGDGGNAAPASTSSAVTTSTASSTAQASSSSGEGGAPGAGGAAGAGGAPGTGGEGGGGTTSASTTTTSNATASSSTGGPVDCTDITPGELTVVYRDSSATVYAGSFTPNVGGAEANELVLAFFGDGFDGGATGVFDLSDGGDANYATCSRCVLVGDPFDPAGPTFFQSGGTMTIDAASDQLNADLDATLTGVTLVEVTTDGSGASTPVPNGECLYIASADIVVDGLPDGWTCPIDYYGPFDSSGNCDCGCGVQDPECQSTTNVVECGGSAINCNGAGPDPTDTTQCDSGIQCTQVTPDDLLALQGGFYRGEVTPALGDPALQDQFALIFYSPASGTFDLGSATNGSYATCDQCVLLLVDGGGQGVTYFQSGGTLVVDQQSDFNTGEVSGTLTNARLVEVTIAAGPDFTTTPVPDGGCIDIVSPYAFVGTP